MARAPTWLSDAVRRHGYAVPAFVAAIALFTWLVTYGDWRLFDQEPLSFYYDSLADSLLHGRLDVSRGAIAFEAFVRDGKYYGYFGMTPSLPRVPLNLLFPALWGQWSRVSMIAGCALSLWLAHRLSARLASPPDGIPARPARTPLLLFLLAAGCGSSLVFLASRFFVYHEAILWGATLALAGGYCLFRYAREGTTTMLSMAGAMAFLALFARPTCGAGGVLAMGGIALLLTARAVTARRRGRGRPSRLDRLADAYGVPPVPRPGRHALIAASFVLTAVAAYVVTNYLKFGTWDGVPVERYAQYQKDPARLRATGGRQLHAANLPTGFIAYFGRAGVDVRRAFPWFSLHRPARVLGPARIDVNDWCSSVPGSMPALFLLACWGAVLLARGRSEDARRLRLPAIALAAGGAIVFCTVGICERYVHDFYPALILPAALAAAELAGMPPVSRMRRTILAIVLLLVLLSTAIEIAFAIQYQRELSWGVPDDKRAEYQRWQERADALLGLQPIGITGTDGRR